jgi:hypothetical protein
MAQAFDLTGTEANRRWQQIAALLTHSGKDPNWRRRPSVLDQLRGWKRHPVARKPANGGHLKQRLKWTHMRALSLLLGCGNFSQGMVDNTPSGLQSRPNKRFR